MIKIFRDLFYDAFTGKYKKENIFVLIFCCCYLAVISLFLIEEDNFIILLAPFIILGIFLFIFRLDYVLLVITLLTPFAMDMNIFEQNRLSIPTEPIIILFTFCFLIKIILDGKYDKKILKHPVSIVIFLSILWMLISSAFSTLPLVSFKYTIARIWFLIPFFYAIILLFKQTEKRMLQFFWCYCFSFFIVLIICSVKFAMVGFKFQYAHHIMYPLYNDHTIYGAVIAMFIPPIYFFCANRKTFKYSLYTLVPVLSIFLIALLLSYSRAAWLSVGFAIGMYVVIRLKINMKWIFLGVCLFGVGYVYHQNEVIQKLEKNQQDSSGNISEQLQSISNISTDASNLERLNRWASAFRMIEERPFFGFGPGTYQFNYASYQKSYQLSPVSTNRGDLGNAHSEYFTPLVDSGIFGSVLTLLIFIFTFRTGVRVYRSAESKKIQILALSLTLGLFTYYVHGLVNNFLDSDKASIPFWGFTAAIVAMDLYFPKQKKDPLLENRVAEKIQI